MGRQKIFMLLHKVRFNNEYALRPKRSLQGGQLLLEILIVIAVLAIIGTIGTHVIYLSMTTDKRAVEKSTALGLTEELAAQVEAIAGEKWQNIFLLTKNSNYYAASSSGKWVTAAGVEAVPQNGVSYSRHFVVHNVCRMSTKQITGITDSNGTGTTCTETAEVDAYDPSTEKLTLSVNWPNADPFTESIYLMRWRNTVCSQTGWTASGSSGVKSCPDSSYSSSVNITTGASLQLCSGGC
jgi:type II secretory pathway pseudopilin PulG